MPRRKLKGIKIVSLNAKKNDTRSNGQARDDQPTRSRLRRRQPGIESLDSAEDLNWFTSTSTVERRRGRTTLKEIWEMNSSERIWVRFNRFHQPIEQEAQLLAGFLGLVARNGRFCPINVTDCRQVSDRNKMEFTDFVMTKFELEEPFYGTKFIHKSVGKKWRDWKHELFKAYGQNKSMEEIFAKDVPLGVEVDQWEGLVKYWFTKEFEDKQEIGKKSREQQMYTHTGGSKSFSRKSNEIEVETGNVPGRVDFFVMTHQKKDGTFMNEVTKKLAEKAKQMLDEQSQAAAGSEQDTTRMQDKVYTEVIGKDRPGRVRGLGMGPTPSTYYGSSSQNYTYRFEVQAVRTDLEAVRKQLEDEKNNRIQLQSQLNKFIAFMNTTFPGVVFPTSGVQVPNEHGQDATGGRRYDT